MSRIWQKNADILAAPQFQLEDNLNIASTMKSLWYEIKGHFAGVKRLSGIY